MTVDTQNGSNLLEARENQMVFEKILQGHRKNTVQAMAVVKLYLSGQGGGGWEERVTGAATLTKDYGRKSYFIQIFDMQYCQQVWEQELYQELDYKTPLAWFHTFEAHTHVAGLSFADEREASNFGGVIQSTLQRRRDKTRQQSMLTTPAISAPGGSAGSGRSMPTLHEGTTVKEVELPTKKKKEDKKSKKKTKGKRKFKPGDIGAPMGFVHVTGMKLGTEGMQMVDNTHMIDPVLLNFLEHAGLKPNDLGEEGLKRAKDMAEQHGLYQEYEQNASEGKKKRDKQRISMMPQPPKTPSGPPPMKPRQPPGPPPSRPPVGSPGSTVRRGPRGPPPSLPTRDPPKSRPPPGGAGGAGPPPPPPPPPPADGGAFPAPPSASSKPTPPRAAKPGGGLSLADQLKGAPNLKQAPPQAPKPSSGGGGRQDLMSQIRQGNVNLRKVDPDEVRESSVKSGTDGGITDVLQDALKTFRMDIAGSSSSDDDSDADSDDDEWD